MTFLTRIQVSTASRAARGDLSDADRMHQRVMTLVPDGLGDRARLKAAVLYRIEGPPHAPALLIQTGPEPDLSRLPGGYGTSQVKDLAPVLDRLRRFPAGTPVRYRLLTAPCRNHSRRDDTGRRIHTLEPLRGDDAAQWWADRAAGAGLDLVTLGARDLPDITGGGDPKKRIRHVVTQFDGTAGITDPAALAAAVTTGIGRGKAYGCAMLSIAPAGPA